MLHPHLEKRQTEAFHLGALTVGQELIVQVMKEPRGGKGRGSLPIFAPGRCMVYMPTADYVAVSKKIGRDAERARLKSIGERLRTDEEGIIIRTVSEDEPLEFLKGDLEYLRKSGREFSTRPSYLLLRRFIAI